MRRARAPCLLISLLLLGLSRTLVVLRSLLQCRCACRPARTSERAPLSSQLADRSRSRRSSSLPRSLPHRRAALDCARPVHTLVLLAHDAPHPRPRPRPPSPAAPRLAMASTSSAQASVGFLSAADDLLTKLLLDYSIFNEPRLDGRATGKMMRFARELRMSDKEVASARELVDKVSLRILLSVGQGQGQCGGRADAGARTRGRGDRVGLGRRGKGGWPRGGAEWGAARSSSSSSSCSHRSHTAS